MNTKVYIAPILHPAGIQRGQWHKEPAQELYLRRLVKCMKDGVDPPIVDIEEPPPSTVLFPNLNQLKEWESELRELDQPAASIDIENAGPHLICVGLTSLSLHDFTVADTVCLRFRRRGGATYWSNRRDLLAAIDWLDGVLGDPSIALIFHNGVTYDVPVLETLGFTVKGRLLDTMVMAHTAYSEFPKSLQFCATLYCWAPCWKAGIDEKDEEEGKG